MIRVSLESQSLSRAEKMLAGIDGGFQKATKSALSRSASHLQTISTRKAAERYAVSATTIRANRNVAVSIGADGVAVFFKGSKIPLWRYNGTSPANPTKDTSQKLPVLMNGGWRTVNPSVPARGHQLNGTSPVEFDYAFVARMSSGHTGIFEREGDAISEIMGSSVPQMLGNDEVAQALAEETVETFDKRMEHEVSRILAGYGV